MHLFKVTWTNHGRAMAESERQIEPFGFQKTKKRPRNLIFRRVGRMTSPKRLNFRISFKRPLNTPTPPHFMWQILFNFMLQKPCLKVENLQQIFGLKNTFDRFGQFGPPLCHFGPKLLSPNIALKILLATILGIPRIFELFVHVSLTHMLRRSRKSLSRLMALIGIQQRRKAMPMHHNHLL